MVHTNFDEVVHRVEENGEEGVLNVPLDLLKANVVVGPEK